AYEQFAAQSREALEWFKAEIEKLKNDKGANECQDLCDVVTYGNNYALHFSQYEPAGYNEVPFEVLKENKRNRVTERAPKIKNTVAQEKSIELFVLECEYVKEQLAKEF
ncbi:MAG: hypothetical protein IJS84_06280, partial [Spirochaetales bacterium]|nr:hypothetical protein [Spirochaetales bacterium]